MLLLLLGACREGPSKVPEPVRDGGSRPPVDAAVLDPLVSRYVALADAQGDERCRCAGDVPFCRQELEADWDAAGRACLGDAIAIDPPGFETALACLEAAMATFTACHAPHACGATDARAACVESWRADGSFCLTDLGTPAKAALVACTASSGDAGAP